MIAKRRSDIIVGSPMNIIAMNESMNSASPMNSSNLSRPPPEDFLERFFLVNRGKPHTKIVDVMFLFQVREVAIANFANIFVL